MPSCMNSEYVCYVLEGWEGNLDMQMEALVPPKPYELVRAILLLLSHNTAIGETIFKENSLVFVVKFIVGGIIPSWTASTVKMASKEPAAPSKWPVDPLVLVIGRLRAFSLKRVFMA